jgi:hypothetical protein
LATRPSRIMTSVDKRLSATRCAVCLAFIRVEAAIGSGPMSSQIGQSEIPHHLLPLFYWLFSDHNLACSRLSL